MPHSRLLVCPPRLDHTWVDALQARLPDVTVSLWQPGAPPADWAVVFKPPQAFFDEQTHLQAVFAASAGVDALLGLRLPARLPIYRLEDAGMGLQMAEYALHAVLRWYRQFDRYATQAAQGQWIPQPPAAKAEWSIGLLGNGVLAQPVGQALRQLGFPVAAWSRTAKPAPWPVHTGDDGLQDLLRGSRVVIALLPLTPATQALINAERLAWMPTGSYFINLARGGLVDEAALLAALDSGRLAGAALDVCATEPAGPEHPFWRHCAIQLTPHIAASTLRDESVDQIVQRLQSLRAGRVVGGRVDTDRGY